LAITRGHPAEHAVIDHPIPREPGGERVAATTEIWRRETFGRYAVVEAAPRTGRLHQIRRHLKHVSCPLIGDVKYAKGDHTRPSPPPPGLPPLAPPPTPLPSPHPAPGARVVAEAPPPADLAGAIDSCRRTYGDGVNFGNHRSGRDGIR